ncbi:MAG: EamA family transporter [Moorea sp. SIO3C2]|nr:EamA family transporter [Moorena sp. SIO3C2]
MTNQLTLSKHKFFDRKKILAIASLSIGVVAISLSAIFIKWSEAEISAIATVFNRFWIAALVLAFWNSINFFYLQLLPHKSNKQSQEYTTYTKRVIILLVALGFVYLVFLSLWAWSITQTSLAISTVLHNLTPIFTTLSAWLLFNKRFEPKFLIGMVLAIVGMIVIGIEDLQIAASGKISGDIAALLSAIFYAVYLLILEQLRSKLSATKILMWTSLTGAILILPILIVTGEKIFPYSGKGWLFVICLAIICQALGHGLVAYSLKTLTSGFVALFLILDPVLTAIEAWAIFSEKLFVLDWIAFLSILIGIYLALSSQSSTQNP